MSHNYWFNESETLLDFDLVGTPPHSWSKSFDTSFTPLSKHFFFEKYIVVLFLGFTVLIVLVVIVLKYFRQEKFDKKEKTK
jgi:hypothetical protein